MPSEMFIDPQDVLYVTATVTNPKDPSLQRGIYIYIGSAKDGRVTASFPIRMQINSRSTSRSTAAAMCGAGTLQAEWSAST